MVSKATYEKIMGELNTMKGFRKSSKAGATPGTSTHTVPTQFGPVPPFAQAQEPARDTDYGNTLDRPRSSPAGLSLQKPYEEHHGPVAGTSTLSAHVTEEGRNGLHSPAGHEMAPLDSDTHQASRIAAPTEHTQTPTPAVDTMTDMQQRLPSPPSTNRPIADFRRDWVDRYRSLRKNLAESHDFDHHLITHLLLRLDEQCSQPEVRFTEEQVLAALDQFHEPDENQKLANFSWMLAQVAQHLQITESAVRELVEEVQHKLACKHWLDVNERHLIFEYDCKRRLPRRGRRRSA